VQNEHLVQVYRQARRLCSGVRVTRDYIVTTVHCLAEAELSGSEPLRLQMSGSKRVQGMVREYDRLSDLALVELIREARNRDPLPDVCFVDARKNELWTAAHRPPQGRAALTGVVSETAVEYRSTREGQVVTAIRLACDSLPSNVRGFSGSPIDRSTPGEPAAVLGVLVEVPSTHNLPVGAMFAGTIREVVRRFDRFRFGIQERADAVGTVQQGPVLFSVTQEGGGKPNPEARSSIVVREMMERYNLNGLVGVNWTR
jgi:hypothetical protein